MPGVFRVTSTARVLGKEYPMIVDTPYDTGIVVDVSIAAAKVGSLTTRTDDNTGVLTMAASHGITDGVKLDVYWDGGRRYNMTVGTVSVNSVPIDGGSGDNLPTAATAITAMIPVEESFVITGNSAVAFSAWSNADHAQVLVEEVDNTVISAVELEGDGGDSSIWYTGLTTNPLTDGDITKVVLSHGDSSQARSFLVFAGR